MEYMVLAADDERELLDILELYLSKDGIRMLKASDGEEALAMFQNNEVHLLLLDIMMPKIDGYGVLRRIRETSPVPAIMISARGADNDRILGLELGADDYIAKPFNPMEAVARVKAQLRRSWQMAPLNTGNQEPSDIVLGGLVIRPLEGVAERDGKEISLTSTEFKILCLLGESPGRVFTKKQIYEAVWKDWYIEDDSALLVHMSNLRNKIESDPKKPVILKTIKGLGYKVEKPV